MTSLINILLIMTHTLPQLPYAEDSAGSEDEQGDHRVPPRQAPAYLRGQPEQADCRHALRKHVAGGDYRPCRRSDFQQCGSRLESYVFLFHAITHSKIDAKRSAGRGDRPRFRFFRRFQRAVHVGRRRAVRLGLDMACQRPGREAVRSGRCPMRAIRCATD